MFLPEMHSYINYTQYIYSNLREHLGGVLGDGVELPADVVGEVDEGLVDVALAREARGLVLLLPRLDVHDRQPRVQRVPEVLRESKYTLYYAYRMCIIL